MEKQTCKRCGKEIQGYSHSHAEYLMLQHSLTHRHEEKKEQKEKEEKENETNN